MPNTDTIFVQNISDSIQSLAGFQAFQPKEIREVSQEDAKILLANPFFLESSDGGSSESSASEKTSTKKKAV